MSDVVTAYWVILTSFLVAIVVGLIYMLFLRICAGVLVFITIVLYLLLLVVIGAFLIKKGSDNSDPKTNNENLKYLGFFFYGFAALSALILCCKRSALKLAVAIVKTAGSFIMDCKTVLLVPPIANIFLLIILFLWLMGLVFVYSLGEPKR